MLSTFSEDDANLFFKQDYHDQGMAKWQGFRLAEHIESVDRYLTSEASIREITYQEMMTPEDISQVLSKAWSDKLTVQIQLTIKNEEGLLDQFITGKVLGFTPENDIILSEKTVPLDKINACILLPI